MVNTEIKYTMDYCKRNRVFIETPTLDIFIQVTKMFKVSAKLRPYNWKYNGKNTTVGFIEKYDKSAFDPCFGDKIRNDDSICYKTFFKDNGIVITEIYELW